MIYIGIDPGSTGAVAAIKGNDAYVWDFENDIALLGLREVAKTSMRCQAVIEKVHSMPKQGVASSFKFGRAYGETIGYLKVFGIPFDYVTPQKWKKEIFDSMTKTDQKQMALDRARRLFPQLTSELKRKKDNDRAEALLIAEYCRRTHRCTD